ncbi:hypothetical protein CPB83DRAFT_864408 [Crepidotus variabilis]|uniref:Uncharacterized protein n=1 Tax=Crepidotus variabilis TaxID=179855 RepID=A0A9P6E4N0_9AGAR|nr:hypothetical protein CPB83DRAFT_864408 [Crepidotus variabilis]
MTLGASEQPSASLAKSREREPKAAEPLEGGGHSSSLNRMLVLSPGTMSRER